MISFSHENIFSMEGRAPARPLPENVTSDRGGSINLVPRFSMPEKLYLSHKGTKDGKIMKEFL
ncbi:hypothetical protein AW736_08720 [Termitidicoccus mucosus]|uniref:Uncharacterized protein n=1 Tax=Termitidicoccus mucosus TaxID=1184151 RepID=A0A178IHK4_9BACT|nr:hypothetical protein AW736_08720 [Opitutaceae bacterium TSB47]